MKELSKPEFREWQMSILDSIDSFCNEHHIQYSLACGTLLGAVRHQGFIPWDDDIDIQMLRKDYDRFVALWSGKNEDKYLNLINNSIDRKIPLSYSKVEDIRTVVYEKWPTSFGVNIDIYPIDNVLDKRTFVKDHHLILEKLRYMALLSQNVSLSNRFIDNIRIIYTKLSSMSVEKLCDEIDRIARKHENMETQYLFEMVAGRIKGATFFNKEDFEKVKRVKFENRSYPIMTGYDHYLKSYYGDYMKLPPLKKRKPSHSATAFLKEEY